MKRTRSFEHEEIKLFESIGKDTETESVCVFSDIWLDRYQIYWRAYVKRNGLHFLESNYYFFHVKSSDFISKIFINIWYIRIMIGSASQYFPIWFFIDKIFLKLSNPIILKHTSTILTYKEMIFRNYYTFFIRNIDLEFENKI